MLRGVRTLLGFFAAALAITAARAAAADPHRVGVIPSVEVNVDARRAEALTGTMADALRDKLVIDAIGGADVMRRLPDGGLPDDCVAQPACIAQIGARLEVDELLFLVIVQVGHTIQIDSTWADVATGKTMSRPMVKIDDDARAGRVFGDAAIKLLPDATLRPSKTLVIHEGGGGPQVTPRGMTSLTWTTGGIAIGALGGALAFGVLARNNFNDCKDPMHACTDDRISSEHTKAIVADSLGVLGVAAAVATGVLYWKSGGEVISVAPAPGGGAAVTFGGRF
jgi:hypothetical protein